MPNGNAWKRRNNSYQPFSYTLKTRSPTRKMASPLIDVYTFAPQIIADSPVSIRVIREEYAKEMVIASQGHSSAAQRKIKTSGMAVMMPMSVLQKQDRGKAFITRPATQILSVPPNHKYSNFPNFYRAEFALWRT